MNGRERKEDFAEWLNLCKYYDALEGLDSKSDDEHSCTRLYHYTSTKVLNSILSNGAFRASNLFYLNDKIEYKMGIEVLKKIFEKDVLLQNYIADISDLNGREWAGIYSISFSNKEDELQQWITYARESGVCIELNPDIIWEKGEEGERRLQLGIKGGEHSYLYYNSTCFLKLAYEKGAFLSAEKLPQLDADRIRHAFAKAILQFNEDDAKDSILDEELIQYEWEQNPKLAQNFLKLLSAYYKEERFRGEGEIRAAFLPAQKDDNKVRSKIEYFEQANGILRPYMDVFFMHNYCDAECYKVECPIKSITVGPGGGQDSVFNSVVHRLEYGDTRVWEYTKEELEKLLAEFVYGCFLQYNEKIQNDWYRRIADKIIKQWCKKLGYQYQLKEATKIKVEVRLFSEKTAREETEEREEDRDKEINAIVESFLRDNYFSMKGIWVKKSSVSYIF